MASLVNSLLSSGCFLDKSVQDFTGLTFLHEVHEFSSSSVSLRIDLYCRPSCWIFHSAELNASIENSGLSSKLLLDFCLVSNTFQ